MFHFVLMEYVVGNRSIYSMYFTRMHNIDFLYIYEKIKYIDCLTIMFVLTLEGGITDKCTNRLTHYIVQCW